MAMAAGAALLFGSAYPVTTIALRSFGPLGSAALQGTASLVILIGLLALGVVPRPGLSLAFIAQGPQLARLAVLGLLGGAGFIVCMNVAVSDAGATITGFVAALYAVFGALFAIPLLGERLRVSALAAFGLALVGTALLAGFEPAGASLPGVVAGLGAAVSLGLYLVLTRRWSEPYGLDGITVTVANLITRGPLLLVVALAREPAGLLPSAPEPAAIAALIWLIVGPSLLGQLLIMGSVRRVPARRTGASLLLVPIASTVVAILLLGAQLTPAEIAGGALVLVGIVGASGALTRLPGFGRPRAMSGEVPS